MAPEQLKARMSTLEPTFRLRRSCNAKWLLEPRRSTVRAERPSRPPFWNPSARCVDAAAAGACGCSIGNQEVPGENHERWQTARDLASELRWIAAEESSRAGASDRSELAARSRRWPQSRRACDGRRRVVEPLPTGSGASQDSVQFTIPLPPGQVFPIGAGLPSILAISPDGQQIVYSTRRSGGDQLYLRRRRDWRRYRWLGQRSHRPLLFAGRSMDRLRFRSALKKMQWVAAPQVIARAPNLQGASWGRDTIVYAPGGGTSSSPQAKGGEPRSSQSSTLKHRRWPMRLHMCCLTERRSHGCTTGQRCRFQWPTCGSL
jgi:hypothetical protein